MATAAYIEDDTTNEFVAVSTAKRARIKGTWHMYWGRDEYEFVDGQTFEIPTDLFDYLRASGSVYDTLA